MFLTLYNATEKLGLILPVSDADSEKHFESFIDMGDISGYSRAAPVALIRDGIVAGKDGTLIDPKGFATRAEAAQIIYNMLDVCTHGQEKMA